MLGLATAALIAGLIFGLLGVLGDALGGDQLFELLAVQFDVLELLPAQELLDFGQLLQGERRAGNQRQGRREDDVQARRQIELLARLGGPHLDDFEGDLLPRRRRLLLLGTRLFRLRRLRVLPVLVIAGFVRGHGGLERRRGEQGQTRGGQCLRAAGEGRGAVAAGLLDGRVFPIGNWAAFGLRGGHPCSRRPGLSGLRLSG
jgi:hypothetical protein